MLVCNNALLSLNVPEMRTHRYKKPMVMIGQRSKTLTGQNANFVESETSLLGLSKGIDNGYPCSSIATQVNSNYKREIGQRSSEVTTKEYLVKGITMSLCR